MDNKRTAKRWWIKLEYSFFQDKMIKAMRRKLGDHGDKALVIYIKILTRFLASDFTIAYEGYEDSLAEEVASDIDEENNVEVVKELFDFLKKHELMVSIEGDKEAYYFPQAAEMSKCETPDAERKRIGRANSKEKKDCPDTFGHCPENVGHCPVIITEQEQEKEKEQEQETEKTVASVSASVSFGSSDWFTVENLLDLINQKGNSVKISREGIEQFCNEVIGNGMMLYGEPITQDYVIRAMRGWVKYHPDYSGENGSGKTSKAEHTKPVETSSQHNWTDEEIKETIKEVLEIYDKIDTAEIPIFEYETEWPKVRQPHDDYVATFAYFVECRPERDNLKACKRFFKALSIFADKDDMNSNRLFTSHQKEIIEGLAAGVWTVAYNDFFDDEGWALP